MDNKTLKYLEDLNKSEKKEFGILDIPITIPSIEEDSLKTNLSELPKWSNITETLDRNVEWEPVGPVPEDLRKTVFERDGFKCVKCSDINYLECDHAKPRSKGGLNELNNLQTLCRKCNSDKRTKEWYGPTLKNN